MTKKLTPKVAPKTKTVSGTPVTPYCADFAQSASIASLKRRSAKTARASSAGKPTDAASSTKSSRSPMLRASTK